MSIHFVAVLFKASYAGKFLAKFLWACAELKLAEVPLVFICHAVSELQSAPLLNSQGLAAIRYCELQLMHLHEICSNNI